MSHHGSPCAHCARRRAVESSMLSPTAARSRVESSDSARELGVIETLHLGAPATDMATPVLVLNETVGVGGSSSVFAAHVSTPTPTRQLEEAGEGEAVMLSPSLSASDASTGESAHTEEYETAKAAVSLLRGTSGDLTSSPFELLRESDFDMMGVSRHAPAASQTFSFGGDAAGHRDSAEGEAAAGLEAGAGERPGPWSPCHVSREASWGAGSALDLPPCSGTAPPVTPEHSDESDVEPEAVGSLPSSDPVTAAVAGASAKRVLMLRQPLRRSSSARVAVKMVHQDMLLLQHEMSVLRELGPHRFICSLRSNELVHHNGCPGHEKKGACMITELCDSDVLDEITALSDKSETLPLDTALRWFREAVTALQYCHSKGIFHCDVKPENVLLKRGHVKLADFGAASMHRRADMDTLSDRHLGSLGYLSPELITVHEHLSRGNSVEHLAGTIDYSAVDAWAMGVLLVTMVTGEKPWERANVRDIGFSRFNAGEDIWPYIPAAVKEVANRCLQVDPAARPSMADLLAMQVVKDGKLPQGRALTRSMSISKMAQDSMASRIVELPPSIACRVVELPLPPPRPSTASCITQLGGPDSGSADSAMATPPPKPAPAAGRAADDVIRSLPPAMACRVVML